MNIEHPAYLKALTFPRFLLACVVVVFHFGLHIDEVQSLFFAPLLKHGAVCVSFFFFLSGLVLGYNYKTTTSARSFWLKRIFRIYPLYIITFFVVLIYQIYAKGDAPSFLFGVLNLLALQSWVVGHAMEVNFPSWSISVEFFFYAAFPLILWTMRKIRYKNFMLLGVFLILLGWIQHYSFVNYLWEPNRFYLEQFILYFPPFHFTTFLAGVLCGVSLDRLKKLQIHHLTYSIMGVIGIVLFLYIMNTDHFLRPYGHNGGLIPVFALICIGLSMDKAFFKRLFGWKPLIYLGDISYGIYMWQFPVFFTYLYFQGTESLSLQNFLGYFVVLIIVSVLSYELIEKPIKQKLVKTFIVQKQW
jgi:peptidoglycan/LPS O-acetylase OafA/YrhL